MISTDSQSAKQPEGEGVGVAHVPQSLAGRSNNKLLVAGITTMVLVFAVGVGGFWAYNRFVNRPAVSPGRVLPPNTLAYITVDLSPGGSQKQAVDRITAAFQSQPGFSEAWAELVREELRIPDLYALGSYLGSNFTLALLPPGTGDLESLRTGSSEEDMLDVLKRNVVGLVDLDYEHSERPLNKNRLLPDIEEQAKTAEMYRDIEIRKYVSDTLTIYLSLLPNTSTAIVAADPSPVRAVIDQFVLDEGLKYDPTYKALLGDLPPEHVVTIYLSLTEISRQARLMSEAGEPAIPFEGRGAWMATVSGKQDGIQLNIAAQTEFEGAGTLLFGRPGIDIEVSPRAKPQVSSLYDVPQDSLAFVVGTDLKSMAETALESFRDREPDGAAQVEIEIKEKTGSDLKRDILPMLGGDYILSLSAPGRRSSAIPSVVSQLKLSPDSRTRALNVVPALLEAYSTGGPVVQTTEAESRFYVPMGSNSAVVLASDRLIQVQDEDQTVAKDKAGAILAGMGKGFGGTDQWKAISKRLPVDSNLIGYADVNALWQMYERNVSEARVGAYAQTASLLRPISYILIGAANYPNLETNEPAAISKLRSHTMVFIGIRD